MLKLLPRKIYVVFLDLNKEKEGRRRTPKNTETLMTDLWRSKGGLTNADETAERRRGVFWSVQGDAAARVVEGDEGRRRRSSCGLVRRKEEEESKKEKGENER